jgi:hypothetical protein
MITHLEGFDTPRDLVFTALAGRRFPLTDEKRTQLAIADALTDAGVSFAREVRLDGPGFWDGEREPLGVIDFMVGSLGLEVKLQGSGAAIYRQLQGYARSEQVESLILVTAKALALPPLVNGKRCSIFSMGRAWL